MPTSAGLTGFVKRKGRGTPTVIVSSLIAGVAFGAVTVGVMAVLTRLRHLIFQVMTANVDGVAAFLTRVHMQGAGADLKRYLRRALHYWPWLMLGYVCSRGHGRVVDRLVGAVPPVGADGHLPDVHKLDAPVRIVTGEANAPDRAGAGAVGQGAVPLSRRRAKTRCARSAWNSDVGEHVAVTGANGSGKTTLMLILAGREPTSGSVQRPGAVGLGKLGGTALVLQHPESQVLGTRVADDVVWGLPPGTRDRCRPVAERGRPRGARRT